MAPDSKAKKNSLSIRLAESAVFLRSDYTHSRRNHDSTSTTSSPDSLLRGLLVMDIAKPTKITNIEAELTALSGIYSPEGMGARRLEYIEHPHVFHSSTILFRSSAPSSMMNGTYRRSVSIGPGVSYTQRMDRNTVVSGVDRNESNGLTWEDMGRTRHASAATERSTPSPFRLPSDTDDQGRIRRLSMDGRPSAPPPAPPYSLSSPDEEHLSYHGNLASSSELRMPSFTETILEDESEIPSSSNDGQMNATPSTSRSSISRREYVPFQDSRPTNSSSSLEQRGRLDTRAAAKRFSLSIVPNILLNAVGSVSPRRSFFSSANDDEVEGSRDRSSGRSPVGLLRGRLERGRTTERRESVRVLTLENGDSSIGRGREGKEEKEKTSVLAKLLGEREEWSQEFMPGTYTYPITFRIPSSAPPTLQVDYASISWKLRAFAHRPGTFHSKLSAERDVIVVACPMEEDTEDSESIIIERNWDQQLQYLISISGRAFFIGGRVPINLVLMPMDKIKIHRITVHIEEKVDYFSRFHRLVRSDPPVQISLLSLKHEGKDPTPILPLESSSPDVLLSSPLVELLDPEEREDASKLDELAASFMGPGPWEFHKNLKLPNTCKLMNFTNKNLQAFVRIGHMLKVTLRVEKAHSPTDEEAKPPLFDIVIQSPILILSCRCNPEWSSLPRYTEVFEDMVHDITPACPCQARQEPLSTSSGTSTESLAQAIGKSTVPLIYPLGDGSDSRQTHNPHSEYTRSIVRSSSLFERLVSGQESETGEAPPSYDFLNDGHGQSSISVAVREVPLNVASRTYYY